MALELCHRDGIWYLCGTVREQPAREQPVYEGTRTGGRKTADAIRTKTENDLLDASVSGQEVILHARATALVRGATAPSAAARLHYRRGVPRRRGADA